MAPPGRPNMTSTPSISRLLIKAWAPVSCMVLLGWVERRVAGVKNDDDLPEGGRRAHAAVGAACARSGVRGGGRGGGPRGAVSQALGPAATRDRALAPNAGGRPGPRPPRGGRRRCG